MINYGNIKMIILKFDKDLSTFIFLRMSIIRHLNILMTGVNILKSVKFFFHLCGFFFFWLVFPDVSSGALIVFEYPFPLPNLILPVLKLSYDV